MPLKLKVHPFRSLFLQSLSQKPFMECSLPIGGVSCQSPPTFSRRLASGLCRNSAYRSRHAALASLSDASGASDKCPVLAQHAGQGALSTKSVLPEHGLLAQNLATQLERYRVGPLVSLLREEVPMPTQEYSRTGIKNRKGGGASSSG